MRKRIGDDYQRDTERCSCEDVTKLPWDREIESQQQAEKFVNSCRSEWECSISTCLTGKRAVAQFEKLEHVLHIIGSRPVGIFVIEGMRSQDGCSGCRGYKRVDTQD